MCVITGLGYWSFLLNVPVCEYVTTERETVFISQGSPLLNGKEPFFACHEYLYQS